MSNHLISIVGPTAIGKTSLSIALAQHFGTQILSADSRQFYREMTVGTAVPTKSELAAASHHFIQHISVQDRFSVGDFERKAIARLESLFESYREMIMVGGSGLYVRSVTDGLDDFPEIDPVIREALNKEFQDKGLSSLQKKLKILDPLYYEEVDLNNPQRLTRALEISIGTGKPYSSFRNKEKKKRPFKVISIGLTADREIIYDRINRRVDQMMTNGLLEEAQALFPQRNLNALKTVGYNELFRHLKGECSLEEAVSEIKKNTRRFAKRQLTWFRKDPETSWFDISSPTADIIKFVEERIKN